MSPYRVAYPTDSSDLLPVATSIQPNLFDSAISSTPRARAWMFSSVRSVCLPLNAPASAASNASTIAPIGSSRHEQPRLSASPRASLRVPSDENRDVTETPCTRSAHDHFLRLDVDDE